MGSGPTNSDITKLDMAEITYFNNQIQRMKFAKQKDGFKNKTKQTNNAINLAMQRLRKDKLLNTNQMKNWNKLEKSKSKGRVINKFSYDNKIKSKNLLKLNDQEIKYSPVSKRQRTDLPHRSKAVVISPDNTQSKKKINLQKVGRRYLMEENKIKSQNNILQYQSQNIFKKGHDRRPRKSQFQIN